MYIEIKEMTYMFKSMKEIILNDIRFYRAQITGLTGKLKKKEITIEEFKEKRKQWDYKIKAINSLASKALYSGIKYN